MRREGSGRMRDGQSRFAFRTPEPGGYRLRPDLSGGIFHDVANYWLQALQERVGPPSSGGTGTAWCAERHGVDDAFEAVPPLPDGATATLTCSFVAQHTAEHLFHLDEARVRVRRALLPAAGAVALNVAIRTTTGHTEITGTEPVSYCPRQLERLAELLSGRAGHWGAGSATMCDRIRIMEHIHRTARREVRAAALDKEPT